jgi:plasmid stabilization system protein ParE
MNIEWSSRALSDLARLYDFLAPVNRAAAARTVASLVAAPVRLLEYPRLGERLDEFQPREVRRIIVGRYEMRYEIAAEAVRILRIWHTREDR